MAQYFLLHAFATFSLFMGWLLLADNPGGAVGMLPILLGKYLLIQLAIGLHFSLLFRKTLVTLNAKKWALIAYILLYELVPVFGSAPRLLGIFSSDSEQSGAFALATIPIVGGFGVWQLIKHVETRKS